MAEQQNSQSPSQPPAGQPAEVAPESNKRGPTPAKGGLNLLPRLSKEEFEMEEKRDWSNLYAAALVLVVAVLWLSMVLVNSFMVAGNRGLERGVEEVESEMASYETSRLTKAELVRKTEYVKEILENDADIVDIMNDLNQLKPTTVDLTAYGKEEGNNFTAGGTADTFLDFAKYLVALTEDSKFDEVSVNSLTFDKDEGNVRFSLAFKYYG